MILNFQKSLIILGCSLFYDEFFQCAKYHLYFICLMFFLYLMIFVSQLKPRPDLSGALFAQRSEAKKRERRAEKSPKITLSPLSGPHAEFCIPFLAATRFLPYLQRLNLCFSGPFRAVWR